MYARYKILGQAKPIPDADVTDAETRLGIRFPTGYREYITRFGEGVLGGTFIRIYPPARILHGSNCVAEWRQRVDEYWFWDTGANVLPKQKALECVIIGDTLGGDEFIFHPSRPDRIYALPREDEKIFIAGDGMEKAIEWACGSGKLTDRFREREFEPF